MKYDYVCNNKDCKDFNKIFEVTQNIKDDKLKTCTTCKKDTLERLITKSSGFNLKGNGWYKNNSY